VAKTKHWLGIVSLEREDLVRADAELREALEDFRRLGDLRQICMVVGNIGSVAMMAGNNTRALAALAESLSMAQSLGYGWWVEMCLDLFGFVAAIIGERERALLLFGATGTLRPQTGEPVRSGLVHEQARILVEIRAELGEGATATILRAGAAMSLQDAVEEALAVGSAAPPPENAPAPSQHLPPPESAGLTAREVDVLRLIVEGKTDPEIAETLFISRATVSKHVGAVLSKLGVPTRSAAAVAAVRRGLV
jgi:DNA-binding CsgD family transcriptional regulator